jgi:Holliday junction DNA helicase RuvB
MRTKVFTLDQIKTAVPTGTDVPERVRTFIRRQYDSCHIRFVLIASNDARNDVTAIPHRGFWAKYYDHDVLTGIVKRSSGILNVKIDNDAAIEIARRSRGTPRIANALLRRIRDFAQVRGSGKIDLEITRYGLKALNIDQHGLDEMDNRILLAIIDKFGGGPVGINTISTAVGEESGTIEEVYEPFLIKEGYLKRTPRGREATEHAYRHLGRQFRRDRNGTLF